ncbi:MAG: DUF4097 domain-containing protein [Cyclobacteriaceae bacterium]|nr:DUF4097 domain-containing protein [Cyclobacteriaceae bacterium]
MKRLTNISIIVLMLTSWLAQAQNTNEFTVPLSEPGKRGRLKAHLNYGSITIKGSGRKDVLVRYASMKDRDDPGSKEKEGMRRITGGGLELEAAENNNQVKVESNSWNVKTDLEIEIPAGMDLDVSTYNDGDIMITNVQGEVELKNYNGEITALNVSGSVVATTYNGDVKITFDKVTENTPMSFSTFNGNIDLTFPAATKATFKMKTEQGDIFTGFDMNIVSSGPVQKKDTKSGGYKLIIDEWKKGDINGGGAEITMKNYNGDIYIRKK